MAFLFYFVLNLLLSSLSLSPSHGLATVNSHSNMLLSKHFSREYFDSGVCLQEAECIPVQNATCFGTSLPYTSTSIALAEDSITQFEVQDNLALWQGLRSVPRCWAVIQPLLCAVYMPKCENGSVFLPSQEMCRITRGACKSVEAIRGWPSFLKCENKKLFPPRCRNPLQEVKFNISSKCIPPLLETDNPDNWFHEVQGCGIQCQNPLFTKEEHHSTHNLISILASVCFGVTVFTVVTFMISWKAANRYPAVIIFYINVCLAIVSFGWLIQFFPGAREEIVCTYDGTIRRRQPRSGEHLCSITFVLIYYFLMASMVWFVILTYAWHVLFKQTGTPKDIVKKKVAYFHISAWSIPLVLTTTVMAMTEVDGDSMSGICFVGYADMNMRIAFLLAPIGIAALVGGFFMACVLYTLIKVKLKSEEVANLLVKKKIRRLILKIGVFSAFGVVFIISTFACHAYDFLNRKEWDESLREYIVCLAMNSANRYSSFGELPRCQLKSRPSIGVVRIHLFCLFGYGIIMSLWVWTRESVESWKRFLYRLCEPADKNSANIPKHKLIKEVFRRRYELNQGRVSFSLNSTHEDPVGMNIDANSIASRDISTSWAAALPHFLDRRNAVTNIFMPRQYSSASDMSRHISMDSFNQPTLDSLSMQISEQEYAHALRRHQRRKTRKELNRRSEHYLRANHRFSPWFPGNRRGSDTSLQSSLVAASIAAAAAAKKAGVRAKVTKATSTGDLGVVPLPGSAMFPPVVMPQINNRPHIQRQAINPPFTHGMTDNSHRLGSRVPSVASALPGLNATQRCTPNQCPVMPNSVMGMVRPPVYSGSFDVLNSVPYGYFGGGMYPPLNGLYSGYPMNPEYMYNPYLQYASFSSCNNQYQQDILPMNPIPDSASETEFFPIRISDSEYTDTGMRSYDELQLMTAQRLMQEHLQAQEQLHAQAAAAAAATASASTTQSVPTQTRPELEPQACAKTQFLKKIWPFKTNPAPPPETPRPPSGKKSAHSEAPPPSPAGSSKSVNEDVVDDDDDDVFEDPVEKKNVSMLSLPQTSEIENTLQKLKSKFRRATSFISNLEKSDTLELTSKPCHSSLVQLNKTSSSVKVSQSPKDILKEKCIHPSEKVSLLNGDAIQENISR